MRRISWKWRKEKDTVNNDPPPYPGPISPSSSDSRVGLHVFHASQDDIVDIVFIHGLGGHWRDTWKSPTAKASWPEILLPARVNHSRIISYGYDSRITNWKEMVSQNSVGDHANNLLRDLANYRDEDDTNERTLFFVVHSMGGIVLQDALVRSKQSPDEHIKQIFNSTKAIVFLGTPHSGTEALATWARGLALSLGFVKQTNPDILETLRANSELLYCIQTAFHSIIRERSTRREDRIEITCFFEELPLRGLGVVVSKHSASLPAYQATGLHYNHSDMTRFNNATDSGFLAITAELVRWIKRLQRPLEFTPKNSALDTHPCQYWLDGSRTIPYFPYSRNADFVGCEDVIEKMNSLSRKDNRLALNGIGGVGKTEIAAEFCYRYHKQHTDISVFWISCDSNIKIDLALGDVAVRLKLPGYDDPRTNLPELATRYLSSDLARPWLMILDNADDIELMTKGDKALGKLVRNFRNGLVVLTTRDRYVARTIVGSGRSIITINSLSPADAQALFRSKLPGDTKIDPAIELKVLDILEYLPLCITQAAAYIDQSEITLNEYWHELTESETSLIEILEDERIDLRRGFDTPNSILRAWKLSFEKIRQRYIGAAELLSVMAFLDRQSIPRQLLQGIMPSRHQLNSALGTLQGFCLVKADIGQEDFRMHRLVQLATKVWLRSDAEEHQAAALKLVRDVFPGPDSDNYEMQRRLVPHGKVVESYTFRQGCLITILADLQYKLAGCEWYGGQYDMAAKTCQAAYEKRRALLGESNLDTLRVKGLLGSIKASQGHWDEAKAIQLQVLHQKENLLGPNHLDTIDTLSNLAEVMEKQGRYADAEMMTQRAYDIRLASLGENHRKTLQSLMNLATYNRRQARYEDAERLGRQAWSRYDETLGRDHVLTLTSGFALAGTLRESGEYSEAICISKRVVKGRETVLGHDHPQTLLAINNLALGYRLNGDLETAESLYRQVFSANEKMGRTNHPDCIQTCQNLAVVLGDLGKYTEAEKVGRDTLSRRKIILGEEHLSTMNTAETLAINLDLQGNYTEAEGLATKAFTVREQRLGPMHAYTLDTLFVLGSIKEHTGRIEDAVADFTRVRDGRTKVLGPDHPTTQTTILRLQHTANKLLGNAVT